MTHLFILHVPKYRGSLYLFVQGKRKEEEKNEKHPNMHRSTWLMSILQLLASLWCTAGSAAWARLLRKRNLTDRKRHETHYACRQTTNARQQLLSLLSLSCSHLFLRVANYTQAHSHEDRIKWHVALLCYKRSDCWLFNHTSEYEANKYSTHRYGTNRKLVMSL